GYYRFFPSKALSLEAEAYYKRMNRQIDYLDHAQMLLNPTFENQLLFGKAKAYGLELMLRKDEGRLTGWIGYTMSRVKKRFDEINGGRAFPAFYDRPHEGSLFLSYQLKPRIRLGLNWNIASGAAYTSPTSFYYYDGQELPVFAERNNDRFQTYHRLDLDAEFRLNRSSGKFDHSISISIFNLYNRNNDVFRNFNKISTNNGQDIVVPGNLSNTNRIYSHIYLYKVVPSIAYNFKFY
ncbi:MAG: TonB-dependent receptor, partial [Saprospiraceae bacterium]|nr:TonB-dependent receptor [Saprospiraceae bacterium]